MMVGVTAHEDEVTFPELVAWGKDNGFPDMKRRVTDGVGVLVNTLPATYLDHPDDDPPMGAGHTVVVKSTRQVWKCGSGMVHVIAAESEEEFNRAVHESFADPRPDGEVRHLAR
jgi:hypothetical protein